MEASPVYLHIGLMKTGTSFLQGTLRNATAELERQGVSLVPRNQVAAHRLSLALRERPMNGAAGHPGQRVLDALPADVAAAPGARCLVTEESLSFAKAPHIERLGGLLAGHDLHLVVTVRDLARAIPSAWQQRVKAGRKITFDGYVAKVVSEAGQSASMFWHGHDLARLIARWSTIVSAERVHVVVVAPSPSPPELLLNRFCGVLDVDPATLPPSPTFANESLGHAQAELLRRVNERLPEGLLRRDVHGQIAKRYFARTILGPQNGARVRLPSSLFDWCRERSERLIAELAAGGYDVAGDLQELMPEEASFGDEAPVAEADVVDAAVAAIAALLADRAADVGDS